MLIAVVGSVGALAVAWLTSWWTTSQAESGAAKAYERELAKLKDQRLWDARKDAYSEVLQALKYAANGWHAVVIQQELEAKTPKDFRSTEHSDRLRATAKELTSEAGAAYIKHRLFLSANFSDFIERISEKSRGLKDHFPWQAESQMGLFNDAYETVLSIARDDMALSE